MEKLIITADLGHFKAYRYITDPRKIKSPHVEAVETFDLIPARQKLSEKVSDAAGRFKRADKRSEGVGAGYGERHNIETENERRLVKEIAESIAALVKKMDPPEWDFAAGASINKAVLEELDPTTRHKLAKNLRSNLINATKSELVTRFQ